MRLEEPDREEERFVREHPQLGDGGVRDRGVRERRVVDVRTPLENFDAIFTSHTIEHVVNPVKVIQNLRCNCKYLFVAVPPNAGSAADITHVGSTPLAEWVNEIPLLTSLAFESYRPIPENPEAALVKEQTVMLMYQGHIP